MRTIIAGSRDIDMTIGQLQVIIDEANFNITEVVSGGARGVDSLGELWAQENKVPYTRFIPKWEQRGRGAGPERNREMANYAEALIAIWDGQSRGTRNMIEEANKRDLLVYVHNTDSKS